MPGPWRVRETPGPRDARSVLELRIHGIKNTPPAEMLERHEADIAADRADDLGGFWRERDPSGPPGVRREAYSWGALARADGSFLAGLGQLVVHIGWFLLLPFGLVNVAYWTRSVPEQPDGSAWRGGLGSGYVRLFGLGLTLLYVMALATVSIELVGVQCYRAAGSCAGLPEWFAGLAVYPRATRLAIFALVPLAGVVVLYLLSARARRRYEVNVALMTAAPTAGLSWPVLATKGFWSRARITAGTERLHVAASAFLLAAMLGWDHIFSPYPACELPEVFFSSGCLVAGPLSLVPWTTALLVASIAGLVCVAVLILPGDRGITLRFRRRSSLAFLAASIAVLAAVAVVTSIDAPDRTPVGSPFLGLVSTPANLVGILLVVGIAALGWRRGVPAPLTATLLAIALVVPFSRYLLAGIFPLGVEEPWLYVVASGLAVALQLAAVAFPRRARARPQEGWSGAGPGVVLLLALGIAMALSTLLVVGVAAWLARPPAGGTAPAALQLPVVWADFALGLIAILLLAVVGLVALLARHLAGYPGLTTPEVDEIEGYERFALREYGASRPSRIPVSEPPPPRVLVARRTAGILHRGEPVLGILALLLGVVLAVTAAPDLKRVFDRGPGAAVDWILEEAPAVALAIIAAGAAAAFAAIAANALTTKERPLGLLWDLICFLPRAGHPFGPPCYSERVVPELTQRIRAWQGEPGSAGPRSVVLSAHSLGAVLATACIFALRGQGVATDRIGLITYGIQLRPYFGRFFPELFGPEVLGAEACRSPSLWARDPWFAQVRADERSQPGGARENSLVDILSRGPGGRRASPAWVSLWRRTDFLGFPATSYRAAGNPIDRGASELDVRTYLPTIATHSHYPLAPQYDAALAEVLHRIDGPSPEVA